MTLATVLRRAFVVGWPIAHSRSPLIHRHWLASTGIASLGIEGSYDRIALEPEKAPAFFSNLAGTKGPESYIGGNVTIPHKETAYKYCDNLSPSAQKLRAVNTLWVEDGCLKGDNTDGYGFTANLDQHAPGWDSDPELAVVLGAGGAARAVIVALQKRGFRHIKIINRTESRAHSLAKDLEIDLEIVPWERRDQALDGARFLVNSTSLGMAGQPSLELDLAALAASAVVTDIVYAPLKTGLLVEASKLRLRTVDGLGMLLHQAVPGFERWFGVRPKVTKELRNLIIADLEV